MFNRCSFCQQVLPANQTLEHFPLGRRVAFDPARGRLWAICSGCRRWNLAPIEQRWEALEELERLSTDRGRLLSQTEHIALLRAEDLDIVRVGKAKLVEEAWWRYGQELQRRRNRYRLITVAEVAAYVSLMAITSAGWMYFGGGQPLNNLVRWRKFGTSAWRGEKACRRCGAVMRNLTFKRSKHFVLALNQADTPVLDLRCKACGYKNAEGGVTFEGPEAERMLRRVLAYHNFYGAKEERVKSAVRTIEMAGSAEALVKELARNRFKVAQSKGRKQDAIIALEIAVNDDIERQWLELELAELEARWREEEELAAIVDGELTELPLLERIRLKLPG